MAVPTAVAIFALLVLAAASVVFMVQREYERAAQRTALVATESSPHDLLLARSYDDWDGEQFLVVWIEPAGGGQPRLPPGMPRAPRPGQAVVSPALDRLAGRHPDLAARYPDRLVLSPEGISSGDELFAYVRVPEDRTLAGENAAVRASAFGPPTDARRSFPLVVEPLEQTGTPVLAGVVGFLVLPGLIVLAVGLAASSEVRDRRFAILHSLGVPRRKLAMLGVLETLVLASPSLLAVTVFWGLVTPRLERVPIVGHGVVRGDLGLPLWSLLAGLAVGAATISLLAVVLAPVRGRRGSVRGPRPASREATVTPLRMVPIGLASLAFVLGELAEGDLGGTLNLVGVVAAIGGVPLVMPGVLRSVGGALGRSESVLMSIVGRGLQWDPIRATRPFSGYAALVVIALAGSGYLASIRDVEDSPGLAGGPSVVTIAYWLDPHPTDPRRLEDALGSGAVLPTNEGGKLMVGATCPTLSRFFVNTRCDREQPYELPGGTARLLAEKTSGIPGMGVELVPREEVQTNRHVIVLDNGPLRNLENRVKVAAMRTLVAPFVQSASSYDMVLSPLVPWLVGGILSAAVALTVGCLLSLVDRLLAVRRHHRQLLNLGISVARLRILEAWQFAVPYTVIAAVSLLAGLVTCAKLIGAFGGIQMPWQDIGVVSGCVVIVGTAGTMSVALFGARRVHEDKE